MASLANFMIAMPVLQTYEKTGWNCSRLSHDSFPYCCYCLNTLFLKECDKNNLISWLLFVF